MTRVCSINFVYLTKKNFGKHNAKEQKNRDSQQTEGMFFTASFAFIYLVKYFQSPEIVLSQDNQVAGSKIRKLETGGVRLIKEGPRNIRQINIWGH